ncbi:sensor domain-containing protein [Nonomuraea jiangxiensis]|uniref:Putative sensor n=1 Tax=Nonomuraea jiangxiensis TaxID=633440 RepID=A0A1G9HAG4_9ACTN|nr:sensor domain-containing protein [Nonomuraea jiangxiensis]SDL09453.1 Putative sensor [Nonomuraea jiangxiensis]
MTNLRHRLATDTRYTLLGLPNAIAHFSVTVAGVAAGLGSAVAFVGLPILSGTAIVARSLSDFERVALPDVLGRSVARPDYSPVPERAGWFRRMMNPLASGQAWIDLLYGIVAFPISLAAAVVTAVWWAGTIAGLTFPLYGWILTRIPGFDGGLPQLLGLGDGELTYVGFNTVIGVLFALTLLPIVRGAALIKASLAQALLTRAAYTPAERPVLLTTA